jgi:hypothetical protein
MINGNIVNGLSKFMYYYYSNGVTITNNLIKDVPTLSTVGGIDVASSNYNMVYDNHLLGTSGSTTGFGSIMNPSWSTIILESKLPRKYVAWKKGLDSGAANELRIKLGMSTTYRRGSALLNIKAILNGSLGSGVNPSVTYCNVVALQCDGEESTRSEISSALEYSKVWISDSLTPSLLLTIVNAPSENGEWDLVWTADSGGALTDSELLVEIEVLSISLG